MYSGLCTLDLIILVSIYKTLKGAQPTTRSSESPSQGINHQPITEGKHLIESTNGPTAPYGKQKLIQNSQAYPIQARDGKEPQQPQDSTAYDHNTKELVGDQSDLRPATNKMTKPASNEDPIGQTPTNTHIINIKRKIGSAEDLSLPKKTEEGNSPQNSPHQV